MDLKRYYFGLDIEEREIFATRCGTTRGHMQNVAYGYKKAAPCLAVAIDRESKGAVTCESLRNDVDWAYLRSTPLQPAEVRAEA